MNFEKAKKQRRLKRQYNRALQTFRLIEKDVNIGLTEKLPEFKRSMYNLNLILYEIGEATPGEILDGFEIEQNQTKACETKRAAGEFSYVLLSDKLKTVDQFYTNKKEIL